jgi:vancomycin permeability regulator SanA
MLKLCVLLSALICLLVFSINEYIQESAKNYTILPDASIQADAILVLGAYVYPDGRVSDMLSDRLSLAGQLYDQKKAPKIIVSGDHGQTDYDEVNAMKLFLKPGNQATAALHL